MQKLRELHAAIDRAVLDAYGWGDVPTGCEFLLDYEIDEEEGGSRRRKPWRYRWPDDVRDEVLAQAAGAERRAREGGVPLGCRCGEQEPWPEAGHAETRFREGARGEGSILVSVQAARFLPGDRWKGPHNS